VGCLRLSEVGHASQKLEKDIPHMEIDWTSHLERYILLTEVNKQIINLKRNQH
jgi:hypothetical protein